MKIAARQEFHLLRTPKEEFKRRLMAENYTKPDDFAEAKVDLAGFMGIEAEGRGPENQALSLDEMRQVLHEMQVNQTELRRQHEELRRKQHDLEASQARYFDLYNHAPVGYFTINDQGLVLEANLTGAALIGVARDALIAQPLTRSIHPEDQDIYDKHCKQLFETGASQVWEMRMLKEDASCIWAQLEATIAQGDDGVRISHIVISDISERKQIEDAKLFLLQGVRLGSGGDFFQSLARYLAESLKMDYVCIDQLEGDCLAARTLAIYFDGKFEDNVTYTLKDTPCGDVVGKMICTFPWDVCSLFPQDIVLQAMKAVSYVGVTLWSSEGQPIGLIAVIGRKPLVNPLLAESMMKLVAIRAASELERKRAEEALQRTALELERSNRDLENFAYVASHDLQEPLRTISSFVQLLEKQYKDHLDETAKEYIQFAVNGVARMQRLILDLLAYSRITGAGNPFVQTDMETILSEVEVLLSTFIEESNAVVTHDPLPLVQGDPVQMRQLLQNLIGNAIKYRKASESPHVHVSAISRDRHWLFSIKDNGIGFEPEQKERIFVIFQRLHAMTKYEGSGIGLAICKRIVERHGGSMDVDSEPGKGSTFYFLLPQQIG